MEAVPSTWVRMHFIGNAVGIQCLLVFTYAALENCVNGLCVVMHSNAIRATNV